MAFNIKKCKVLRIGKRKPVYEGKASIYLYADDAKIYKVIESIMDSRELQVALDNVNEWSDKWLLKLNASKCKSLTVSGCKSTIVTNYSVATAAGRQDLERVNNIKDVGVIIDEKLCFRDHINEKVNKAYMMLGIIKRNFKFLEKEAFKNLYKAMVRSHLEYAQSSWSPRYKKDIELIEKVQKRATKLVAICKNKPYEDRLRILDLPTLKFRRIRGDMIEAYKIVTGIYDIEAAPALEMSSTTMTRGSERKLSKVRCRTELRKHFFTQRITDIWNSLPSDVRNSSTLNLFKSALDRFWKNQAVYYDYKSEITGTGNRSWKV